MTKIVDDNYKNLPHNNIYNQVCGINYDFLIKFEHLSKEEEYLRERLRLQDVIGPR